MSEPPPPIPSFSPAPGVSFFGPIVPMTFGQIIERIFLLMRSHYKPFIGVGMLPIGALFTVYGLLIAALTFAGLLPNPTAHLNTAAIAWAVIPVTILTIPVMILIYGPYYGAQSYAALQADRGLKVTAREALRIGFRHMGRYAWLMLLRALIVAIPIAVCGFGILAGVFFLGLVPKGNPNTAALFLFIPLAILLYLGSIVYAVIMSLRLSLAYPACVWEGLSASQAIKRSGALTKGAKGRIFLALLVIYALGYAIFLVVYAAGMAVVAVGALVRAGHMHPASLGMYILAGLFAVCAVAFMLLWTALLMAGYSTAFAVFYRDQCLRKDDLPPATTQAVEPA
jgi:hypothetical protein